MDDKILQIAILVCVRRDTRILNCLKCLSEQDYPKEKYSVLVVENDDTPKFEEHVRMFGFNYCLVTTPGIGQARAIALEHLKGDIIANTDADCIPNFDWLSQINLSFTTIPKLGVLGGVVPKYPPDSWIERDQRSLAPNNQEDLQYLKHISKLPYVVGANAAYSGKAFRDAGGFNAIYVSGSDVDIAWRIQNLGYSAYVNRDMVVYHSCRKSSMAVFNQFQRYSLGHVLLFKYHSKKWGVINWYPKKHLINLLFLQFPFALMKIVFYKDLLPIGKCWFDFLEYTGIQWGSWIGAIRYKVIYL